MTTSTPSCERCGDPFLPTQPSQKYCSATCREAAKKRRSRLRPLAGKLLGTTGDTGDTSLTGAYERATPPRWEDVRDDDFEQADAHDGFDDLSGDRSYLAPYESEHEDVGETSERISGYLNQDTASRERRGLWSQWKQLGNKNGVQPPEQVQDRVARRRAAEKETLDRLTNAPGQVQNRFNPVTRNVVAEAGRASRKLNSYKRRAEDMPRDMQSSIYSPRMALPENVNVSVRGRPVGARSYSYNMEDGFRF
jgi:hypothetical protein